MTQAQILNEIRQLSIQQQWELLQSVLNIFAERLQVGEQRVAQSTHQPALAEAANLLLADYMDDKELTIFTVLDGEPFYEEG